MRRPATLLAMYIVVAEERGIARDAAERHDPERHPQGVHRARHVHLSAGPEPRAHRRDLPLLRRRGAELESDLDLRLPHSRGRSDGRAGARVHVRQHDRVRAARARRPGLAIDSFAPRLSFFFAAHNDLFEEVAKFRAARRLYARLMRDRFGATDASARLRFHTQTGGVTLTAQQPLNNVVRVAVQTLAATLGGTQSLHTNGYDEALALPTAEAATLALRTQQIVAHESGVANTADPLAGSYYVESLTDELEERATRADRAGRRARRRGARDRAGVLPGGDRAERVRAPAARRGGRDGHRRREPLRRRRRRHRRFRRPTSPRSSTEQVARVRAVRAKRDARAVETALGRVCEPLHRLRAASSADAPAAHAAHRRRRPGAGDRGRDLGRAARASGGEYQPGA